MPKDIEHNMQLFKIVERETVWRPGPAGTKCVKGPGFYVQFPGNFVGPYQTQHSAEQWVLEHVLTQICPIK